MLLKSVGILVHLIFLVFLVQKDFSGTASRMPDSATPSAVSLPDEYMKIAQLRFSASQRKPGAGAELMTSIKKHGVWEQLPSPKLAHRVPTLT